MRKWVDLFEQLLDEASEAPPTSYGYWIKDDGSFVVVDYEQHERTLGRLGMSPRGGYDAAYSAGWIRVVAYYPGREGGGRGEIVEDTKELSVSLAPMTATARAMASLRKLASNPVFSSIVCDLKKDVHGYYSYDGEFFDNDRAAMNWLTGKCQAAKQEAREPALAESVLSEAKPFVSDILLSRLGKEELKLWIAPYGVDYIMKYGQHDQLCYGAKSLRKTGDPSDDDAIPWQSRAIEAGWIRASVNKTGTEINLEFARARKLKASIPLLEQVLDYLPNLEVAYVEIHRGDKVSQYTWSAANLLFGIRSIAGDR